jgi:hypothetical protein
MKMNCLKIKNLLLGFGLSAAMVLGAGTPAFAGPGESGPQITTQRVYDRRTGHWLHPDDPRL